MFSQLLVVHQYSILLVLSSPHDLIVSFLANIPFGAHATAHTVLPEHKKAQLRARL